jgi:hypothetical protein
VILLDKLADGAEAVLGEELGPRTAPRVVLGSAANASRDVKAKDWSGKSFGCGSWRAVEFCELLSKG